MTALPRLRWNLWSRPAAVRRWRRMPFLRRWHLTPLDDAIPWMPDAAVEWLHARVTSDMHVFEWGAGGSTLFFAARAASVTTVEHDAAWFAHVNKALRKHAATNVTLHLRPPIPAPSVPQMYRSSDSRYDGMSFEAYARTIEEFPQGHFDVVVVDGRARPGCMQHGVRRVRPGGCLALDNSDRDIYSPGRPLVAGWTEFVFTGEDIYHGVLTQTTAWVSPLKIGEFPDVSRRVETATP